MSNAMINGMVDVLTGMVTEYNEQYAALESGSTKELSVSKIVDQWADDVPENIDEILSEARAAFADIVDGLFDLHGAGTVAAFIRTVPSMLDNATQYVLNAHENANDTSDEPKAWTSEQFKDARANAVDVFNSLLTMCNTLKIDVPEFPQSIKTERNEKGNLLLKLRYAPQDRTSSTSSSAKSAVTRRLHMTMVRDGKSVNISERNGEYVKNREAATLVHPGFAMKFVERELQLKGSKLSANKWEINIPADFGGGILRGEWRNV